MPPTHPGRPPPVPKRTLSPPVNKCHSLRYIPNISTRPPCPGCIGCHPHNLPAPRFNRCDGLGIYGDYNLRCKGCLGCRPDLPIPPPERPLPPVPVKSMNKNGETCEGLGIVGVMNLRCKGCRDCVKAPVPTPATIPPPAQPPVETLEVPIIFQHTPSRPPPATTLSVFPTLSPIPETEAVTQPDEPLLPYSALYVPSVGYQVTIHLPENSTLSHYLEPDPTVARVPISPVSPPVGPSSSLSTSTASAQPTRRNNILKFHFIHKLTGRAVGHAAVEVDDQCFEMAPTRVKVGKKEKEGLREMGVAGWWRVVFREKGTGGTGGWGKWVCLGG